MSQRLAMTVTPRRHAAATRIAIMLIAAVLLAGCGKKGTPVPPPGEPSTFPRTYPSE